MPLSPYLTASKWIDEFPHGFRLRWQFHPDEIVAGKFLGLPDEIHIDRTFTKRAFPPTSTPEQEPTVNQFPSSWWDNLGDVTLPMGIHSKMDLPKKVQGVKFTYNGNATAMRVWDSNAELVFHRKVTPGEFIYLESSDIKSFSFFNGTANLNNIQILDLFDNHDAGIVYETIATLSPRATVGMSHNKVYQRYSGVPTIDKDEWEEFQAEIVNKALNTSPADVLANEDEIPPWTLFQSMLGIRWEYTQLYCMGFVDGPDTPNGTAADVIHQAKILSVPPTNFIPVMYRIRCVYKNHNLELKSNPVIMLPPPMFEMSLVSPQNYAYKAARVQLFGEDAYQEDNEIVASVPDKRVIGLEVEESFNNSPILGTGSLLDHYFFRSWQATDRHEAFRFMRRPTAKFYDQPMRFRLRSVDGWDRVSAYGPWTNLKTPQFTHNPAAPIPLSAWRLEDEVTIVANNESQSFSDWVADHAVTHTPNSKLEVLRKVAEPETITVTIAPPSIHHDDEAEQLQQFGVLIPAGIADPSIFIGGYLISGKLRASIIRIHSNRFIFTSTPNGNDQAAFLVGGEVQLQQANDHDSLYQLVTDFPIDTLPERLTFSDLLPASEYTAVDKYALRVNMGILKGSPSNTVEVIRNPEKPLVPPPFSVDVLGLDFYKRTLLRLRLDNPVATGKFSVYWAHGNQSPGTFDELAAKGEYGAQETHNAEFLYDILSLPVPQNVPIPITVGLQAVNDGGFKSPFMLVQFELPVYEQI